MGYTAYLTRLLHPLGAYDLSDGSISGQELYCLGQEMDALRAEIEQTVLQNGVLQTADQDTLLKWLALLPVQPQDGDLEWTRTALKKLLQIRGRTASLAKLDALFRALIPDGTVLVKERNQVEMCLPSGTSDAQRARDAVSYLLPAQVAVTFSA